MSDEPEKAPAPAPAPAPPPPAAPSGSLVPLLVVAVLVVVGLVASSQLRPGEAVDVERLLEEGKQKLQLRGPEEALPSLRAAQAAAPEDPRTNRALAQVLAQLDKFDEALPYLERAVAKDPDTASTHALLGTAYLGLHRFPEAERELQRALELDPQDPSPLWQLGLGAGMQNDPAAGERWFRAYLEHPRTGGPQRAMAMNLLAGILDAQGRFADGTAVLSSLSALLPGDVVLRRRVDQRLVGPRGEGYAETLAAARERAAQPGARAGDLLRLARLLARSPREREGVRPALEKAAQLDDAAPEGEKLGGWPQFALATEELRDGRLEPARLLVDQALQLAPGLQEARLLQVELLRRAGQFEQARTELERLFDDRQLGLQARLETVLTWLAEGKPEEALAFARGQAEGHEPLHPGQLVLVAALAGAGQPDKAADVLQARRDALPEGEARSLADGQLGQLWLAAGKPDEAVLAFERALHALRAPPPGSPQMAPARHPPPDVLLWAGVAALAGDRAKAEALWGEGAVSGLELVPEALSTWGCRRLLGRCTAEELESAARSSALEDQNDGAFLEGLRRELEGDAAGARAGYQRCLELSRGHDFPADLARARLSKLPE